MTPYASRPNDLAHPDDATLVAWLDDELPAATAAVIARAVQGDPELTTRVQLLRASRAEFAWALGADAEASPRSIRTASGSRRLLPRHLGLWLLAAAAVMVVFAIDLWTPQDRDAAAENDLLAVRLTSPRVGWDLFSGVRFTIEGQAKTDLPCRILARRLGESDDQMAARALADNEGQPVVPVVLTAELQGPDGMRRGSLPNREATFTAEEESQLTFELIDLRVPYLAIAPLVTVRLDEDRAREDFQWALEHAVRPVPGENMGCVIEEPGPYRLQLQLRALPDADGKRAFDEPLSIALGFTVDGVIGAWSEPVDGMRARIVASRGQTAAGQPLAVAVQLRNDSDRARGYNVTGRTMAEIPQPFHFDLLIDGEAWQQRDDLGVITAAVWTFLPQPVGTMRSLIVLTDYWQREGRRPSALTGEHQVAFRFHFEPSVWNSNDRTLWMGKIDTPPIAIEFEFASDR